MADGGAVSRDLVWAFLAGAVAGVYLTVQVTPARGHDSWISSGQLRNQAGEWCCGVGDCGIFDDGAVRPAVGGYAIDGFETIEGTAARVYVKETVPQSEVMPSQNGRFVRCHHPDGNRRCFFAPPPNS